MILLLLFIVILVIFVAEIGRDGLWHSLLTFFNVLFSGTLTMNFFEPLALRLDVWMPSYSYFVDLLAFWGLFIGFSLLIRIGTQLLSKVRISFFKPIDIVGGFFFGLWTGWVVVALVATSLHLAPLPVSSFAGGFQPTPEFRLPLSPDRGWLALMHKISQGSFAQPESTEGQEQHIFDPEGKFILTYGARRGTFQTLPALRVQRIWGSGQIQSGPPTEKQ